MLRRACRTTGLVGILALTGCGLLFNVPPVRPHAPSTVDSQLINGIRSYPDHRGLVVSYIGGSCDGPARLVLTESRTRIDARVAVKQKQLPPGVICDAAGHDRTVNARLSQPIGDRTIWAAGREYVPFDGARLLEPSTLPPGFTGVAETGGSVKSSTAAGSVVITTTWTTGHFEPRSTSNVNVCPATRGELVVQIGPVAATHPVDWTKVGTVKIAATTADLYRQGTSNKPDGWAYVWTRNHSSVEVGNFAGCESDRLLSRTELLRVADSLRPA